MNIIYFFMIFNKDYGQPKGSIECCTIIFKAEIFIPYIDIVLKVKWGNRVQYGEHFEDA